MSKRIFALVLTALLSLSVMTACAGNASSSQQSASSAASEAPVTSQTEEYTPSYPIVSEKVTFTAAVPMDNVSEHLWYKAYEEATNVAIDWQYWSDWETQLGVALSGNEVPDIIFNLYNTGMDKAQALKYGQQKYFINYKDYLKYMPDLVALMDAHPESYKTVENDDGSMYALPAFLQTLTAFAGTIYYRTDMFQEAGIEAPKTTDDLLQATKDLQSYYGKDNKNFIAFQPYSSTHLSSQLLYYLFPAFGDEVDMEFGSSDGKTVTYNYTSEQYRHLMEYMSELYASGGFDKNVFSEDGTNAKAVLLANNAAITTYGTLYSADNFKSGNYDVDLLAPLTSEYTSKQKYAKSYSSRMASFEISTKCSDIETLVKWVNALYTTEENEIAPGVSSISMWLGVKGENWDYDDDSKETYTIKVPEGYDGAATNFLTEFGFSNANNCIFMSLNSSSQGLLCKGNGTRDNLLPYGVDVFPKNYLSFTDDESTTLAENYTDINKFVAESQASFITTGVTDDSWNAYVSAINGMGIDQVLAVYQAAFDRYNA
ncbi:MAG: hypothetical protein ACOYJR_08190 [Acutalibacteraceae bacterium]|jgi:putative aldouronate transport system substrate-binding protein